MKSFEHKVAAITGAGSGIGRALALGLARQGCHLALSDVNQAGLNETAAMAIKLGVKASTALVNVADRAAVEAWAAQVMSDYGQVNAIFNNAGVAQGGTVEANDYADYEWVMNINFWGVVNGTKAFLPHLKASGCGHIINTSSIFGLFAQPGMSAYNASKFAVRGFTESLRQELDMAACGVSASCVHPGGIKTNIALTARMNDSMSQLTGQSVDEGRQQFNDQLLRTSPEQAAKVIINGVLANKRRILIGGDAVASDLMQRLLPALYQRLVVGSMRLAARFSAKAKLAKKTPQTSD
jgi:NAD(P)-dependent dehydrogenase (short-subunit alcohol dehydrogenase family)